MNAILMAHQCLYVSGWGYVLVIEIQGKDIKEGSVIPQKFLLSGVN